MADGCQRFPGRQLAPDGKVRGTAVHLVGEVTLLPGGAIEWYLIITEVLLIKSANKVWRHRMNSEANLSWQDAIIEVLREADTPLDHHAIASRILSQRLRTTNGMTPAATVSSELGRMIRSRVRVGREVIQRTSSGFARTSVAEAAALAEEEELGESNKITFINAYGLNWQRNTVDWGPTIGNLRGYQADKAASVDFADQDGIFFAPRQRNCLRRPDTNEEKSSGVVLSAENP